MNVLIRVSLLLLLAELACRLVAARVPRLQPTIRALALFGALAIPVALPWIPAFSWIGVGGDGTWRLRNAFASPGGIATAALAIVWLAGAVAHLTVLVGARRRLAERLRDTTVVDDGRLQAIAQAIWRQGVPAPALRWCADATTPFTTGWRSPVIVLPHGAVLWSHERLAAVLTHELAHVRRRDLPTRLALEVMRALFWFHPLVRWHVDRLRVESEIACDHAVILGGARPSGYAEDLVSLAGAALPAPDAATFSERHALGERIRSILASPSRLAPAPRWMHFTTACVALPLIAAAASIEPLVPARAGRQHANASSMTVRTIHRESAGDSVSVTLQPGPDDRRRLFLTTVVRTRTAPASASAARSPRTPDSASSPGAPRR